MSAARALAQALSNMVTSNEILVERLWELYLDLPEDEVVLMYVPYCPSCCTNEFLPAACLDATIPRHS